MIRAVADGRRIGEVVSAPEPPCAVPKLRVGAAALPPFSAITETARSLFVTVVRPVGVKLVPAAVLETVATSSGELVFT